MRVSVDDTGSEIAVCLHVPGSYAPDVMADLKARLIETYRDALITKLSAGQAAAELGDSDPDGS